MAIVTVLNDEEALASVAAERVTSLIEASIAARQAAHVCLSGGRTPRRLYERLADPSRPWRSRIDWTRIHVFWTDERQVPPDHADSNFGMAYRALLSHVPIPEAQVHRMRGELPDPVDAAREYERLLPEALDVLLLGLGEDAHIASIFPGSPLLDDAPGPAKAGPHVPKSAPPVAMGVGAGRLRAASARRPAGFAAAVWVEHLNAWRITLTPPALLNARVIVVLVSGASKAAAVRAALDEPEDAARRPAQILRAAGDRVEWLIDSAAARRPAAPPS